MSERRIIKVGGSLLDLPDLASRLQKWVDSSPKRQNVYVMGGGNFCNELRTLHNRFELSESISHDLSLDLMGITARLLGDLLNMPVLFSIESIKETPNDAVFDCRQWAAELTTLPQSWDVTSDSISALLTKALDAELVLMKSVDGWNSVDAYFQQAAEGLNSMKLVNLRKL